MNLKTAIIVPTLGTRNDYLMATLNSIRSSGTCHVVVVAPSSFDPKNLMSHHLVDQAVIDPMKGLPAAINLAVENLPDGIKYFNWLGDDDLLYPNSLTMAESSLEEEESLTFVWGSCDYVDEEGRRIWRNSSGQWATKLFRFGPNLVPQPGALIRLASFREIAGLSTKYRMAFDLDMFIKLVKKGPARFLGRPLARFRWHGASLSVAQRKGAVKEASEIRKLHLPKLLRPISSTWELPVRWATVVAGKIVTFLSIRRRFF